jgi:hypothetical protein
MINNEHFILQTHSAGVGIKHLLIGVRICRCVAASRLLNIVLIIKLVGLFSLVSLARVTVSFFGDILNASKVQHKYLGFEQ